MNSDKNLNLARKAFPYNEDQRVAYMLDLEESYDQTMQDFMGKACEWLSKQPMSRPVFWTVEDFKNYMQDE